jgi:hypothetical protein
MRIVIEPTEDVFETEEYHNEIIEHFKFMFTRYIENTITIKHNFVVTFSYNPNNGTFKLLTVSQNYLGLITRAISISSDKMIRGILVS